MGMMPPLVAGRMVEHGLDPLRRACDDADRAGRRSALTDPLLRRPLAHLRRLVPLVEALPSPDAVLLSHLHYDHLDMASLRRLGKSVRLIVPQGAGSLFRRQGYRRRGRARAGRHSDVGAVTIGAVPAHHDGRRYPFGRRSEPSATPSPARDRVYFAGDTDYFEAMAELGRRRRRPAPGLRLGRKVGPGHLDPARAADALRLLGPRLAIPIHWGTYAPMHWRLTGHEPPHDDPAAAFAEAAARGRARRGRAHPPAGRAHRVLTSLERRDHAAHRASRTMQRNPMWAVDVSTVSPCLAAGR